jgi:hypothetical protein
MARAPSTTTFFAALGAATLLLALPARADAGPPAAVRTTLRCGWFDNPTPGNASLLDRDGEWTIALQGTYEARGAWPRFKPSDWVPSGHGSAGHGCACLRVVTDDDERNVVEILSSRVRPLSACRQDRTLREPG